MDYYCYIARSKVDQLYSGLEGGDVTETSRQVHKGSEKKVGGGLTAVFSLLSGELSYGRSDFIQKEEKLKMQYVQKLSRVLRAIATDVVQLGDEEASANPFVYYRGVFRVAGVDEAASMVQIASKVADATHVVHLDCSLKNFSEPPLDDDGTFQVNSSNYSFFKRQLAVEFETVFLRLRSDPNETVGSPLFLKLQSQPRLAL